VKTQADYMAELDELKSLHGWNDLELAEQLETTSAMLSKWRNGKVTMSAKTKNRILRFFQKIALESNIESTKNSACALSHCPAEPPVDRFLQVVLEVWEKLPIEERAQVAGLAAALSERAEKKIG